MNTNHIKKKVDKSKNCKDSSKSSNRIEALKVTIEKKKQCNARALDIVANFSEVPISECYLLENLQFINQEHYQDIIEERAINKLCGYPVCTSNLKNIPSKQYHISTAHNKVFDITDRKNFCSNLCYKASKYLKDQISTSPVWLREGNSSSSIKLISLQSKGGIVGEEVDLGHTSVKQKLNAIYPHDEYPTELNESIASLSVGSKFNSEKTSEYCPLTSIVEVSTDITGFIPITERTVDISSPCDSGNNPLQNETSKSSNQNDSTNLYLSKSVNEPIVKSRTIFSNENKDIIATAYNCTINSSGASNIEVTPSETTDSLRANDIMKATNINEGINSDSIAVNLSNNTPKQKLISKSHKKSPRKQSVNKAIQNKLTPIQNVVVKIECTLKEWFSIDSLCFMFGEEKVKEMLSEKKSCIEECNKVIGTTVDAIFYERYLAICKKLNILELEDTKEDASFREEVKKPLPDYKILKEEAEKLDLKVKMFYKGDKLVHFEEQENTSNSESSVQEPVLPLVDLHAQKALRRRIVIDSLRRVLQDLQKSLGLRGFNLYEDVRTLVNTFTLSAHNITMKPAEWNLIALVIIKLLSLKDTSLDEALKSNSSSKHLTLLLMSYSLDVGYLDRLLVWLTDIESLLQRTE